MPHVAHNDIRLHPFLPFDQAPGLRDLHALLSEQVYTVKFPQGAVGQLMTLGPGELEGMKTTSIMGVDGIVATAGLSRIDIAPVVAHTILNLRQLSVIAKSVNDLAEGIGGIERFIRASKHAELENVTHCLRDLSRRIGQVRADASYKSYALAQLAAVKKTVGEYFQMNVGLFQNAVRTEQSDLCRKPDAEMVRTFEQFKYHDVVKALSLLTIVELFEIVIEGSFSDLMFDAARQHLQDRRRAVADELDRFFDRIIRELEWRNNECRNEMRTYSEHVQRECAYEQLLTRTEQAKAQMLADSSLVAQALDSGFHGHEVETLFLSARDGLLVIEDQASVSLMNEAAI